MKGWVIDACSTIGPGHAPLLHSWDGRRWRLIGDSVDNVGFGCDSVEGYCPQKKTMQ